MGGLESTLSGYCPPVVARLRAGDAAGHTPHPARRGLRPITLEAEVGNAPAIALYRSCGLAETTIYQDYALDLTGERASAASSRAEQPRGSLSLPTLHKPAYTSSAPQGRGLATACPLRGLLVVSAANCPLRLLIAQ